MHPTRDEVYEYRAFEIVPKRKWKHARSDDMANGTTRCVTKSP